MTAEALDESVAARSRRQEGGSLTTFESLLVPVLDLAYRTAFHLTRNRLDAEDLVQEASLRAFRAFGTFQLGTHFKAWFLRILTNQFLQDCRKQQREPRTVTVEDVEELYLYTKTREAGLHSWSSDPAGMLMRRLDEEHVAAALADLPEEYRVVCVLYFMEDLTYQEIAEMVGRPIGTVRSRLHRGRKMLQKALWRIAEEQGIVAALSSGKAN